MKIKNLMTVAVLALAGCVNHHSIVTTAQSCLGISVSENPATQLYEARAGIVLNQIAFVPCWTNSGAIQVPNVIQEFRVNNLFAGGLVYQRLAVGAVAVAQPGASLMFSKDASGALTTNLIPQVQVQLLQRPHGTNE